MPEVTDNTARHRFELNADGAVAHADYAMAGDTLVLLHTEVPAALSGQGVGSALARGVLDDVRRRGLKILPRCEFMAAYIERHPEYGDLLAPAG